MLNEALRGALKRLRKHPNLPPTFLALATGISTGEMQTLLAAAVRDGLLSEHTMCCGVPPLLNVTAAGLAALES